MRKFEEELEEVGSEVWPNSQFPWFPVFLMKKSKRRNKKIKKRVAPRVSSSSRPSPQKHNLTHGPATNPLQPLLPIPIYYSDLKSDMPSEEQIDSWISGLRKTPVFIMLTRFNLLFSMYEHNFRQRSDVDKYLMDGLIDDELYRLVQQKFANENSIRKPIFHRQQLLLLMRRVLLESTVDDENFELSRDEGLLLGKLALLMNNLIHTEEQANRLSTQTATSDNQTLEEELCTQMLPSFELSNPPDIIPSLIRNYEYFNIANRLSEKGKLRFSDGRNLNERFLTLTHLNLKDYLLLIFAVYLWFKDLSNSPTSPKKIIDDYGLLNFSVDTLMRKMKFSKAEREAFLQQTAGRISTIQQALQNSNSSGLLAEYDFTAFRTYPLIYVNEAKELVSCIDSSFLAEKVSSGVYHTINKSFEDKAKVGSKSDRTDQKTFLTFWGTIFEIYVNDRLRDAKATGLKKIYISPKYEDTSHEEAFDAVLDYGEALVVFEHKGKYVDLSAKYSGRRESLLGNLQREDRIGKGIFQLADNIDRVFNKKTSFQEVDELGKVTKTFTGKDIDRVKRVYPVIVHQDFALRLNCINMFMQRVFAEEMAKRPLVVPIVKPFSLICVQDLEAIIPYLVAAILPDILEEYIRHNDQLTTFERIFDAFLQNRGTYRRPDQWMAKMDEQIHLEIRNLFIDLTED